MAKTSKALAALTQAALLLPGIAAAEVQSDYLFSEYREQDIPGARTASGNSQQRYDIQSHLFRLVASSGEQALSANLTYESMSGASPWYVMPGADGRPVQVMSGASIREKRTAVEGTWSLPLAAARTAFTLGYSSEDDYRAISGGAEVEISDERKILSWTGGIGYSSDTIEPTRGSSSPEVIDKEDKGTLTLYGGAALVVDEATVAQLNLSYTNNDGYLTDPYKLAYFESISGTVAESRPDGRQAWAVTAKLRRHFSGPNAALHVDYRYYHDDWEINAHTLEVSWQQSIAESWRLTPSLRWYTQSQAFFYAPYYDGFRADGFASSDYRLSPFGALSARLDLIKSWKSWALGGGVEYYDADAGYALKRVDVENPGLVQYLSFQLRLAHQF